MGVQKRIAYMKELITVEPLVICYVTAKAICDPALKNLELEKACRVNSQFNATICGYVTSGTFEDLNFTAENDIVQSHITIMHSWQSTTANVLAILIVLFLGSYSDFHKIRKPFILTALFGQILALSGCMACVQFMTEWPLEIQGFTQEVLYAFFGGEKMLMMAIYAYISDISSCEMRTFRVAIIQAIYNVCYTIGETLSGVLLHAVGYMSILTTSLILCVMAVLYGVVLVQEPRVRDSKISVKEMVIDIFNTKHVLGTFKLLVNYKGTVRANIITILIVQYIYGTVISGESSVMFLFAQTVYEWTVTNYSFYMAILTITNSFGLFVIVPLFTKVFKLHDLTIIALSMFSKIVTNIITITITTETGLYISCIPGVLRTLALVGIRSQLTKYVGADDIGKALSFYTVVDSLAEGIASQIYNNGIYECTRASFPQAFLLLGIAILLVGIVILIWMYFKRKTELPFLNAAKKSVPDAEVNNVLETTHL